MGPTFATASIKACQNRIPMHDKTLLNPSEVRRMDMAWGSFCGRVTKPSMLAFRGNQNCVLFSPRKKIFASQKTGCSYTQMTAAFLGTKHWRLLNSMPLKYGLCQMSETPPAWPLRCSSTLGNRMLTPTAEPLADF